VLYVGNGLNDLEVMKSVGHAVAPADAHQEIKNIRGVRITQRKGGEGVLIEVLKYLQERI
jgi:3-deoxy-D-manno-octulosonate 8-phosphate phosphatase KdsC-like HAD superfamily phosphatase